MTKCRSSTKATPANETSRQLDTQTQVITVTDDMTVKDLARVLRLSTTEIESKLSVLGEVTDSVEDMCALVH